jgi:hypothetical protein
MTDSKKKRSPSTSDTTSHRSRTYERPDFPYRCGRERLWSSPCGRGPNADGSCGGVSECLPTRHGDRWRCSRPLWAGGPCKHGPKPDGSCYTQRPPCKPQSSSPVKRRRAGLIAAAGSIALIAAFFSTSSGLLGFDQNFTIPGPLTAAHANLIDGERCSLCHEGHAREGLVLAKALVEYQDMSMLCSQCHGFDGQSRQAHNIPASGAEAKKEIGCIGCHTEHKGINADISFITDADCHSCHEADRRFESFAKGSHPEHPSFSESFGRLRLSAIAFDHAKHFDTHFKKPEVQSQKPASCLSCHEPSGITGALTVPSFEQGCAACHEANIKDQPLLLLTWPEMEMMAPPDRDLAEQCRLDAEFDPDDFEPASYELPDLIEAFLMDIDPDDMTGYGIPYQRIGHRLASEGVRPLAEMIQAKGGDPDRLLAGLAPETIANPACRWMFNQEYQGFAPLEAGGWIAEPLGLVYRPGGHADLVLASWLGFASRMDSAESDLTAAFRDRLLDPEDGPGLCASCHVATGEDGMVWTSEPHLRRHSVFDHRPHLAINDAAKKDLCGTCHERPTAGAAGQDFQEISLDTCQACHGAKGVGDACTTCHRYHPRADTKF